MNPLLPSLGTITGAPALLVLLPGASMTAADFLTAGMRAMAECFPATASFSLPGGHDWPVWRLLWGHVLAHWTLGDFCQKKYQPAGLFARLRRGASRYRARSAPAGVP